MTYDLREQHERYAAERRARRCDAFDGRAPMLADHPTQWTLVLAEPCVRPAALRPSRASRAFHRRESTNALTFFLVALLFVVFCRLGWVMGGGA